MISVIGPGFILMLLWMMISCVKSGTGACPLLLTSVRVPIRPRIALLWGSVCDAAKKDICSETAPMFPLLGVRLSGSHYRECRSNSRRCAPFACLLGPWSGNAFLDLPYVVEVELFDSLFQVPIYIVRSSASFLRLMFWCLFFFRSVLSVLDSTWLSCYSR